MSLPSVAIFYNEGKQVGAGLVNVGWTLHPSFFKRCIKDAMDDAWERYREGFTPTQYTKRYDKYFTTEDELRNFTYIIMYEFFVPRDIAFAVYNNKITNEEW